MAAFQAVSSDDPIGHASFARFISSDPELSVYRRFNHISARNILYLQSEISDLEERLREFDAEDYREERLANTDHIQRTRCWRTFSARVRSPGREKEKMELILRIRVLVKEYQEALLLQSQVLHLESPRSRVWDVFTKWFKDPSTAPFIQTGISIVHDRNDLVALRPAVDKDRLSRFIQRYGGYASYIIRNLKSGETQERGDAKSAVHTFSEDHITQLVTFISVSIAATLLNGSIIGLYFVHSDGAKLGMITTFTVLFAMSMALFTNARRAETFAATAAYAAVLVVFVSGNLTSGTNT